MSRKFVLNTTYDPEIESMFDRLENDLMSRWSKAITETLEPYGDERGLVSMHWDSLKQTVCNINSFPISFLADSVVYEKMGRGDYAGLAELDIQIGLQMYNPKAEFLVLLTVFNEHGGDENSANLFRVKAHQKFRPYVHVHPETRFDVKYKELPDDDTKEAYVEDLLRDFKCVRCVRSLGGGKKLKCGKCRVAVYCNRACQLDDWNNGDHRAHCQDMRTTRKFLRGGN